MTESIVKATWEKPLESAGPVPESADVVIIGGGIVGVSTAWQLALAGVSVVLCEKGHVAGEQSGRNWGWVRVQGRDRREMPMMLQSMRMWRTMAEDIGEDVGYVEGGCLFAASKPKDLAGYENWMKLAGEYGLDTRLLDPAEANAMVENKTVNWCGGIYTASDGCAEPHKAAPAIARAAERAGATVITNCAVRGLDVEAGRVSGVVTERGTIRTSTVLCAAGAWTSMFCRSLGITLPQLRVRGTVVRTAPGPKLFEGDVFDDHIGIRRRQDGGYTVAHGTILDHSITPTTFRFAFKFLPALFQEMQVLRISIGKAFVDELRTPVRWDLDKASPFEAMRVLNPDPNPRVLKGIRKNIDKVFPALADTPIAEAWAGMVETTPDVVPVIEESDKLPGFHIASGFSGHGFGLGPGAGYAIAGLLQNRDTGIDLQPFRLSRFFDGTPITMDMAI